jgi:hypothetical protein
MALSWPFGRTDAVTSLFAADREPEAGDGKERADDQLWRARGILRRSGPAEAR